MPSLSVTLTGDRHTDGTEGRVSVIPRNPWKADLTGTEIAPGPMFFRITSSGTLENLDGSAATLVPTYDSSSTINFSAQGSSYQVLINIAGQKLVESWTVDGANASVNWSALGIKPNAQDRVTVSLPLTVESPTIKYALIADLPAGDYRGRLAFVEENSGFYGNTGSTWIRLD